MRGRLTTLPEQAPVIMVDNGLAGCSAQAAAIASGCADLLDRPAGGLLGAAGVTGLAGCSYPIRPIPASLLSGS